MVKRKPQSKQNKKKKESSSCLHSTGDDRNPNFLNDSLFIYIYSRVGILCLYLNHD
jgi:hypothetical protein